MLVVAIALLVVDLPVLDPLLSIAITAYILYNVLRNLRQTFMLFLQAVPEGIDLAELQRQLSLLPHVYSTHHTHVWSMDGAYHVLTTHGRRRQRDDEGRGLSTAGGDCPALCRVWLRAHGSRDRVGRR